MLLKVAVRAGADCKVKPAAFVGHLKITLAPEGITDSCGGVTGNERLNTVPSPKSPPPDAVPYRVLPDKIKLAKGVAPSLPPLKSCSVVKPVPSVLMANTVPTPELPPSDAVPYSVSPDKIKAADGFAPSLLV